MREVRKKPSDYLNSMDWEGGLLIEEDIGYLLARKATSLDYLFSYLGANVYGLAYLKGDIWKL